MGGGGGGGGLAINRCAAQLGGISLGSFGR